MDQKENFLQKSATVISDMIKKTINLDIVQEVVVS